MKYLLIMIHNHQPIGNFKDVILKAFYNSYIPFLEKILKYKNINIALHTSGILFEFMEENNIKDYEDLIKELLKENRIELISGTFYEAVLPLIPEEDKINQIKKMNNYLSDKFNFIPKGMWLTERIWEPDLPKYIKRSNIDYTLIDDNAFRKIGFDDKDLNHYYITEDEGFTLNIFPIQKKLRYLIPFKDVNEVLSYIRSFDDNSNIFTYGDDGEKFGLWPGTYDYVYKNGYLDKFLSNLNQCEDIKTMKFIDILNKFPPRDRVYFNVSSYEEMEEWSNGNFRNFLSKYNESNKMHKRMLFFRNNINVENKETYNHLLKSQCNDAYWHGIFGGLYLPHLREAIYEEILNGENSLNKRDFFKIEDFDKDGFSEIIFIGENFNLFLHQKGARVIEIDRIKDKKNLSNVITRYKESYHNKLLEEIDKKIVDDNEIKTIHNSFIIKDRNVVSYLKFDKYFKENFLIHFLHNLDNLKNSIPISEKFDYKILSSNKVEFYTNEINVTYEIDKKVKYNLRVPNKTDYLAVEMNLYFPEDRLKIEKNSIIFNIDDKEMYIKTENSYEILDEKIFTISSSESGIEKIYQGTTLFFIFYLKNDINLINMEIGDLYEK